MHTQFIKKISNCLVLILMMSLLTACGTGFFDKDNTPIPTELTKIKPEIRTQRLWSVRTGSGTNDEYLKMNPTLGDTAIVTTSTNGYVTSVNKTNGHINWQTNTGLALAAGPGLGDNLVVVGSRKGDVLSLSAASGGIRWKTNIGSEILAKPAIHENVVLIKTSDGYLRGLSADNGHELWSFRQAEPSLILRGASAPLIRDTSIIAGFANGNLAKLSLHTGRLLWLQTIAIPEGAFAIQRMIDIDADPILFDHHIYAATYQGKIASVDWTSGRIDWTHDISSYTGMTADEHSIYISDARSRVWSFAVDNGDVNWRQSKLEARVLSAPADMGRTIVLGDAEGYLHWLDKGDGHFVGREYLGSAIYAAPIAQNNIVYVLSSNGNLTAYSVN